MYTSLSESLSLPLEYLKKQKKNYSPPKKNDAYISEGSKGSRSLFIKKSTDTKSINYHSGKQWQAMFNIKRGEQTRWRTCKEVWKGKKAYFPRRNLFR